MFKAEDSSSSPFPLVAKIRIWLFDRLFIVITNLLEQVLSSFVYENDLRWHIVRCTSVARDTDQSGVAVFESSGSIL